MSASSWNFKDNLTVDNNKFLKFLDTTGITKNNILGLNTSSHLFINSAKNGDIYFNTNNSGSNTFLHINNSGNTFINSKLAVGISNTSNIYSNITLPINGFIGLNSTQGVHTGYLGLAGSSSLSNTTGSKILLYGIDSVNSGQINMYSGNNTAGHVQIFTGNNSLKMQVLNNGTTNFQPDGTTIRLSVTDAITGITNPLYITSTVNSTGAADGALVVYGGACVSGDTYINGVLTINSLIGNISFSSSSPSTGYSSGATYFHGGVGIICTVGAISETSGGALSVAGGLALGKNAILVGNITIYNTNASTSAVTGSGIFYGGMGVNGQLNIRSNSNSQIKLTPVTNNNETSIYFGNQNNYTTSGSWVVGQNVNSIGNGNFGIYSADNGNYMRLSSNTVFIDKYTSVLNTLNLYNNSINNYITFRTTQNNIGWSIGRIVNSNDDFQISRYSAGNLIAPIITSDTKTGNINILGTENSTSSISGGALTVSGGASFSKDVYIGGNIYGGTVTFSGNLQSTSTSDVNSFSYLTLTATDESVNLTSGSLVTFGGITIQCSTDATSITNGGGFLVAGGASVVKSVYIGDTMASNTITTSNAFITNSTIGQMYSTNITNTNLLATNVTSSNTTTTNLRVTYQTFGTLTGTNITTTNLVSTNTSIGTLNNTNIINTNLSNSNSILTNITSTNTLLTNINTTNTTITNSILSNETVTNSIINTGMIGTLLVTTTANLRFNSNTVGSLFTTGGNVGINTTSPGAALDVRVTGDTGALIAQFGSNTGSAIPRIKLYDQIYPGTQGPKIQFDAGNISIIESSLGQLGIVGTYIGINTTNPGYTLDVNGTFRSNSTILIANTVNSITNSMGAINISGDIALSNSTRNTIVFSQAGVSAPTRTTRSLGTKMVLYPNVSASGLDFALGIENSTMWFSSYTQFKWYSGTTSANMFLTGDSLGINTNNVAPAYNLDVTGTGRFTSNLLAQFNSNTLGNLYTTGGNVGINNVYPSFRLDVSGTTRITSGTFAATFNSNTIGNLWTTGGNVGIQNTSPNQRLEISSIPYSANQDGGIRLSTKDYLGLNDASYRYFDIRLKSNASTSFRTAFIGTLSGGVPTEYEYMSLSQDGFVNTYAKSNFANITSCSNSSTGSVVLQGGLSIDCPTNATSVSNGGALTIAGGAAIAGDLIVGGSISYANAAAASSTFAYLTLTASDWSTDVANGALVVFGGISIQNTANAYSATEGNGLTVSGGVGIGADLYVGQVGYIPRVISTNNTTMNLVVTNATTTNLNITNVSNTNMYITNGLRASFNSNTLGNLFTTGGNIGVGTSSPTATLAIINDNNPNLDIGSASSSRLRLWGTNNDTYAYLQVGAVGSSGNLRISQYNNGTGNINKFEIYSNTTSISGVLNMTNTLDSSNSTTANLVSNGGISISKTTNATSVTSGGALTVAGGVGILKDVYVGGTVTSSSDRRLKKNFRPLESMLDKIENIIPLKYNSIHDFDNNDHIGFIAQDFEENFPELLMRNSQDAYYSLAYDRITALNMACIKELRTENSELKERITKLEKVLNI